MPSRRAIAVLCAALAVGGLIALRRGRDARLTLTPALISLPADGREHLFGLSGRIGTRAVDAGSLRFSGASMEARRDAVMVAPEVMPGVKTIAVRSGRARPAMLVLRWESAGTDSFGDGTPDFLRLHTAADRRAFRNWFTWVAEVQAATKPSEVPSEIKDCAALLRYAYRESLRQHDDRWLGSQEGTEPDAPDAPGRLGRALPGASVAQWHYPATPLGDGLFRVKGGGYQPGDANAFAQFADARSLMLLNTHFVAHDIGAAKPGDILFYRQLEQDSQYHSMIVISGLGMVSGDAGEWVVYHTGPIGKKPGEIRRVRLRDLLHHPDARWRPLAANANFLGVYRWNILREEG